MLKQKKWNRDNPQYNLIEGFRNGPDLDQDPSKITQPPTDKDQAIKECLEETGIDLNELNVPVTPLNFTKDNGQEHYNIWGARNNFVLQNVSFFYAMLPQNISLPTPSPIDSTEEIEKGFWIKVKDIKEVNGHVRFTDPDTEQECGLGQSTVVSKALRDALKKHMINEIKKHTSNYTIKEMEEIEKTYPSNIGDAPQWLNALKEESQKTPVFTTSRAKPSNRLT